MSSGECHYWYRRFPATPIVCHGTNQTTTVSLICEVQYQPLNSSDSIEVRWYRSRDEETVGTKGEVLNDVNKYLQFKSDPTLVNQTFIRQYYQDSVAVIGGTTGAKWWSTMCHCLRLHMDTFILDVFWLTLSVAQVNQFVHKIWVAYDSWHMHFPTTVAFTKSFMQLP